jgi:transposase InsO family protein
MPWKGQTMEERRADFVRRVLAHEASKSALCREYGISRPTGDKWITRYRQGEPMTDRSRAPLRHPNRTPAEVENSIINFRKEHPAQGAKKLKRMLENEGKEAPAYSTINAILQRNGLITKEASQAATPYQRFEKDYPNEMWQADFKGHFAMQNGQRCHPLTVLDDNSRFLICMDAKENERYEGVKQSLTAAFEQYGLPETFLCDNGNPWGTAQSVGYTKFEIWLMDLGILTKHGRIRHPQTQGKEERFNGTLKKELLNYKEIKELVHAQTEFDLYREFYNCVRPHHALELDCPCQHYVKSRRELPKHIYEWEYGPDYLVRRVKSSGYLTIKGQGFFLSEALGGKTVGVKADDRDKHIFRVYYRQFRVAKVNVDERVIISRKPYNSLMPYTPKL